MADRIDFSLTPQQRADARAALLLLDGTGISLAEAARKALGGTHAPRRISVEVAVDEFVRSRLELRPRTVEWYEHNLKAFGARFGKTRLDDIDRAAFHQWVLKLEPAARRRIARACRALFRWGMGQEPPTCTADPTMGLETASAGNGGEAEFLTVKEVGRIMEAAGSYRAGLALLFFAGVRPEELHGRSKEPLLWRHVRVAERIIRIPGTISKTGKPRIIDGLPETVWHFIGEPGEEHKPITPGRTRQALEVAQKAIAPRPWPHDATRHTFCTYALAAFQDSGKVAFWAGHEGNPTMLHRHYRGMATEAEGKAYFALRPAG